MKTWSTVSKPMVLVPLKLLMVPLCRSGVPNAPVHWALK